MSYMNHYIGDKKDTFLLEAYFSSKEKENYKKQIIEFLSQFDKIIYAMDPDLTGCRGFEFYFDYYFNISMKELNEKYGINFYFCNLTNGYFKGGHIRGYKNKENLFDSKFYLSLKESYLKKDFFEYNYNLNSLILFNNLFKKVSIRNSTALTRNMIQTLYIIKNNMKMSESKLMTELVKENLGSAASRNQIIKHLMMYSLITHGYKTKDDISLSIEGINFMNFIHPIMRDSKLGRKLDKDIYDKDLTLEAFKEKWNPYLEKSFSKQKNYLRKFNV